MRKASWPASPVRVEARAALTAGGEVGLGVGPFPSVVPLSFVAPGTGVRVSVPRWPYEFELGPDRLAGRPAFADAPPLGECVYEDEPATRFPSWNGDLREAVGAGVRDLDAQGVPGDVHDQPEVTPWQAAVRDGVRGEFGDDVRCRVEVEVQVPTAELFHGEEACEAGCAWRG